MTTPVAITAPGHILQGLSKLLTPFRGRPRIASWCAVTLQQVQSLEDALWVFAAQLDVDSADAVRLNLLGRIVGQQPRGTVEQMRRFVKCRILTNRSRGRAPDLIKIAGLLLGGPGAAPPAVVFYTEGGCTVVIEQDGSYADADPVAAVEFLRAAKTAAVGLRLITQEQTDGFLLGNESTGGQFDAAHGLSDEAQSTGGYLAGIY